MTGPGIDSCTVAQHQISLEIDGRLSQSDARELAQHLSACGACRAFRTEIHVLSERVADLPLQHGPVDLAQRARKLAAKRRADLRSTSGARWQRAASILIGALSLLNAYGIGRHRMTLDVGGFASESRTRDRSQLALAPQLPEVTVPSALDDRDAERSLDGTNPASEESDRGPAPLVLTPAPETVPSNDAVATIEPLVPGESELESEVAAAAPDDSEPAILAEPDPYIARASRALLSDLAVLDEIPQDQRVPLLRAQMQRFGLADWIESDAARADSSNRPSDLASVLKRVRDALESSQPESALHRLRVDPDVGLVFASLRSVGPLHDDARVARPDASQVVANVAAKLGAAERAKLEELLRFKESWIEGSYGPAVRVATGAADDNERMDHEPFGPSLRVAVVSALTEAGGRTSTSKGKRAPRPESIRVPYKPIEFMHLENARFDVGDDGNGLTIRVDYGSGDH